MEVMVRLWIKHLEIDIYNVHLTTFATVRIGCGLHFSSGIELASESELKSELVFSSSLLPISTSPASVSLASFRLPIVANAECLRFQVSGLRNFFVPYSVG